MQIRYYASILLFFLLVKPASAQTFVTNGSATSLGGGCYQLTPDNGGQAGSIFSTNPIDLTQEFTLDARLYYGTKDANGADGIVFIFATTNTALGVGGGGLGYQGITPSIAIEYDDYLNGWGDPAQDHMAIISNGVLDHTQPTNLAGPTTLTNIEDGEEHCFSFLWDPATQTFGASHDGETIFYVGDIINNIFSGNPIVYFGFSSGTGSLSNVHRVCVGPPVLEPMEDLTVCQGESVELEADQNGIGWDWTPHPSLDPWNIYNPTASPGMTTEYRVDIMYACEGFLQDSVIVTVVPAPNAIANNNGPICPGEQLQLLSSGGTSYDWDGPNGYSSSQQNPVINNATINHAGIYTVTITDANGCTNTAETEVELLDLPDVDIDNFDNPVCIDGDPFQLNGIPGGGDWGGEISPTGIFDPDDAGEGTHTITYTITDGNGCTNTAEVDVEVVPNTPADITPEGPFCVSDLVVSLVANPPGGTWGESADSDGQIYPGTLGIGSHLVTYALTGQDECYNAAVFIEIIDSPVVMIEDIDTICTSVPFTMIADPPGGTWSGATSDGIIDPAIVGPGSHQVIYSYALAGGCAASDTSVVYVSPPPPSVANLVFDCDPTNTTYTITFEIFGGDPTTYDVQGSVAGSITPVSPYTFTSQSIPSETPYSFVVTDAANCGPVLLSGNYSCLCGTNAGSLDGFHSICENGILEVGSPVGWDLDANDTMVWILHTGNPDSILVTGQGNGDDFALIPPMVAGVTYYVSVFVGNQIAGGIGVDTTDPCLSISSPMALIWYPFPEGAITAPAMICSGDSIDLIFTIDGIGPYTLTYNDGVSSFVLDSIASGYTVSLLPSATTTYTLEAIRMFNDPHCLAFPDTSVTVVVTDVLQSQQSLAICEGDSVFLENEYQFMAGIYVDTLTASLGCDSVVETTLTVNLPESIMQTGTTCIPSEVGVFTNTYQNSDGCDSTVIATITYSLVDTTTIQSFSCDELQVGVTETMLVGVDGCDSLVIDSTFLLPSDTTNITSGSCDPLQTGIFTTLLTNGAGCDSVIIETVSLLPSDATSINSISCSEADTGVFIVTLQNSFGCDSTVTETVTLAPSYQFSFADNSCIPNDTGVATLNLFTIQGCDSTITTTTSLLASSYSTQFQQTCFPSDTGTAFLTLTNANGCDSLVYIITSLLPADTCAVEEISRDVFVPNVFSPNGDGINDIFFVIANPDVLSGIQWLRIYDRWGGLVFENTDLQPNDLGAGWNGTVDDELMNPAVFVWQMHLTYADGVDEMLFGNVTLLR